MLLLLLPLLKRRDTYYVVAILILALLLATSRTHGKALQAALDARPQVHESDASTESKRIDKGQIKIVKKYLPAPNCGGAPVLAEEDMERAPTVITEQKVEDVKKDVAPACPAPDAPPRFYAGVMLEPGVSGYVGGLRGGYSFAGRVDTGVWGLFQGPDKRVGADVSLRFR